jgi:effector-binding domain-containing protein
MKYKYLLFVALFTSHFVLLQSCGDSDKKNIPQPTDKDSTPATAVTPPKQPKQERAPIINITDTLSIKRTVICIKDSATTFDRVSLKLGEIYMVKIGAVLKKNGVKTVGQPIAWYKTDKAPYFFEAGVPIDKKPTKITPNMYIKELKVDSVTVAHFYGPYSLLPQAYEALRDWMKDHHKKLAAPPYEIYVSDPVDKEGHLVDPYRVQTDVVFPWK